MGTDTKPTNVIMLRDVRLSFLTLGLPEYFGGAKTKPTDKARWSATALVPFGSPLVQQLDDMIVNLCKTKWEKKWEAVYKNLSTDPKLCFKTDGNRKDYAGYADHWACTAHRNEEKGRPLVYDSDKSQVYKADGSLESGKAGRLYSGAYGNVHISLWAQDNSNGKAIRAELLGVQRTRDGDAFSGGMAPDANAFEEIAEGADADDLT